MVKHSKLNQHQSFGRVQPALFHFLFLPNNKASGIIISHGSYSTPCGANCWKCSGVSNGQVDVNAAWEHAQTLRSVRSMQQWVCCQSELMLPSPQWWNPLRHTWPADVMRIRRGQKEERKLENRSERDVGRGTIEDRNVWNAFARCLSLIKSEYGRNATLKKLDKQKGGVVRLLKREVGVSEGREESVVPAERYSRTNLPHVLLQYGVVHKRWVRRRVG